MSEQRDKVRELAGKLKAAIPEMVQANVNGEWFWVQQDILGPFERIIREELRELLDSCELVLAVIPSDRNYGEVERNLTAQLKDWRAK